MTDQSAAVTERPDEAELNELVWAHNPKTNSPVKQMTRGKLRLLSHAYEETSPPDGAAGSEAPALAETPPPAARNTRPATRTAGESEQKEQS